MLAQLLLICIFPALLHAGEISGYISNAEVGSGVTITAGPNKRTYTTKIRAGGYFRFYVYERGTCRLTLLVQGRPSIYVTSAEGSVSYNLILDTRTQPHTIRRQ